MNLCAKRMSKICIHSLLATSVALATHAAADEHNGPKLIGEINAGILSADNKTTTTDAGTWVFRAELGVKGAYKANDDVTFVYQLTADFADIINNETADTWTPGNNTNDNVYIDTAVLGAATSYGTFLIMPRTKSGQWRQLYGNVAKFDYNQLHAQTGSIGIFGQINQAKDLVAYVSPAFGKHFRFIPAAGSVDNTNGDAVDWASWRVVYNDGKLNTGIGQVWVSENSLPTDSDYNRYAATFGYKFDAFTLGATYEMNQDHPTGDWDAYGVSGQFDLNDKWTATMAYATNDKNNVNKDAVIAQLKYNVNKNVYAYLETGQYSSGTPDNVAGGISIKF